MLIAGKIALVAGTSGDTGSAIAHDLAEAGADVAMADVVPSPKDTAMFISAVFITTVFIMIFPEVVLRLPSTMR
jgi:NAD(P)-dependent dehydrogenase (short-subunit alcohol dehydrogenase family)